MADLGATETRALNFSSQDGADCWSKATMRRHSRSSDVGWERGICSGPSIAYQLLVRPSCCPVPPNNINHKGSDPFFALVWALQARLILRTYVTSATHYVKWTERSRMNKIRFGATGVTSRTKTSPGGPAYESFFAAEPRKRAFVQESKRPRSRFCVAVMPCLSWW